MLIPIMARNLKELMTMPTLKLAGNTLSVRNLLASTAFKPTVKPNGSFGL